MDPDSMHTEGNSGTGAWFCDGEMQYPAFLSPPQIADSCSVSYSIISGSFRDAVRNPKVHNNKFLTTTSQSKKIVVEPEFIKTVSNGWITVLLFTGLILFVWLRIFYYRRFSQLISVFTGKLKVNQLLREGNIFNEQITVPLFLLFIVNFSLFLFRLIYYPGYHEMYGFEGMLIYGRIILLVLIFFVVKLFIIELTGFIFNSRQVTNLYLISSILFLMIEGVFLLFANFFLFFSDSTLLLSLAVSVFLLIFLFSLIRGMAIGLSSRDYSLFYLFIFILYIEIIPYAVIGKILVGNITAY